MICRVTGNLAWQDSTRGKEPTLVCNQVPLRLPDESSSDLPLENQGQTERFPNVGRPPIELSHSFRQNDSETPRRSPCFSVETLTGYVVSITSKKAAHLPARLNRLSY